MVLTTFFKYQQKMPKGLDISPLLELSRTGRADHPLRASNPLLPASILNREAAKDAIKMDIDRLRKFWDSGFRDRLQLERSPEVTVEDL